MENHTSRFKYSMSTGEYTGYYHIYETNIYFDCVTFYYYTGGFKRIDLSKNQNDGDLQIVADEIMLLHRENQNYTKCGSSISY